MQHTCSALNLHQNLMLKVVWYATVWTLWIHRNQVIFKGGTVREGSELLEGAQIRAWHWLTGKVKGFHLFCMNGFSNLFNVSSLQFNMVLMKIGDMTPVGFL